MRLILSAGGCPSDLNLSHSARASVVLAYVLVLTLLVVPFAVWPSLVALGLFAALNYGLLRFMVRERGWWFALFTLALTLLFNLMNGVSVVAALALHLKDLASSRGVPPTNRWMSQGSPPPGRSRR